MILTAVTTILGLVPLATGVPVMYTSVDGTKRFFANLFWHWPTRPFRRALSEDPRSIKH